MYHQLAVFTPPGNAFAVEETAKAIWRARGFELNADVYMHRQALIASLPMTLSERFHRDLKKMRHVTRKTMANAIHLAPLIAEWRGTRTPTLVFGGRRGQLMTLDLYDNDLGNYNFAIIDAPGSGKSVLMNEMAWSYRAIGAKIWMLDLGRSFEKLCRKAKGTYIEFRPDIDICLNPFSSVQDINEDIDMLVPAIAKMASMQHTLEEVQYKAISAMILKLFREYGRDLTVTGLCDALKTGTIEELGVVNDPRIRDLAIMLNPYARGGQYERCRWVKAWPATSSIRPRTCCSPTSWKTTHRSTNCARRATASMTRSPNCCVNGDIRYEDPPPPFNRHPVSGCGRAARL